MNKSNEEIKSNDGDEVLSNPDAPNMSDTGVNKNCVVIEKEFKSDRVHKGKVTGVVKINEDEFLTCSQDSSMKVWDKHVQGASYTYETHEPLHSICVTGEKQDYLVLGLGRGNFILYGLTHKNQLHIMDLAHAEEIVQILSLRTGKLQNKYFATRCVEGHVNVWSVSNHPDKLFTLWNIDGDEAALAHLQPPPPEPEPVVVKEKKYDEDGEEIPEEEEEPVEEEEDDGKPKKVEPVRPVAPLLVGRPEPSGKDRMIDWLNWKHLISSSATIICISNYHEGQVLVCLLDVKTRSNTIIRTLKNHDKPTALFQVNEDHLYVGTEGGYLEIWDIDQGEFVGKVCLFEGSKEGISNIVELENPSQLITMNQSEEQGLRYIVTAASDMSYFKIQSFSKSDPVKLNNHLKINTSLPGIALVKQTSPTQLVCINNEQTLKFYDFVDKAEQQEKEENKKSKEAFEGLVGEAFKEADTDCSGWLDIDEVKPICETMLRSFQLNLTPAQEEAYLQRMFKWLDTDNSGRVTFFEFKVCLMRAFINRSLPEELQTE